MKIYIKLCLLLSFLIVGFQQTSNAQIKHSCGSDHIREQLHKSNPTFEKDSQRSLGRIVEGLKNNMEKRKGGKDSDSFRTVEQGDLVIPVVVHVLYGCENVDEDLPMYKIQNAIDELNEDFSGLNACDQDTNGNLINCDNQFSNNVGNLGVTFALAHKDEHGNPTNGVNRIKNSKTYEGIGGTEELTQIAQWDRSRYMNLYILNKVTPQDNSGIAHYPQSSDSNELLDMACVAYWAVDPDPTGIRRNYDYILTHEVGHWFGLPHIWGSTNAPGLEGNCGKDDFDFLQKYIDDTGSALNISQINDTPPTIGHSTIVTDTTKVDGELPEENCSTPRSTCGNNDMFDNFMDYSGCAKMFSKGQVDFMASLLLTDVSERNNLVSPENKIDAFYGASTTDELFSNNTSRAVFERSVFYESSANDGSFSNALNVEVIGTGANWAVSYSIPQSNFITVNPALPSGLSVKLTTDTNTKIGVLSISGSTTQQTSGEYTFTINSNILPGVDVEKRTKKVHLEFNEEAGITYEDISPNKLIGPEADFQGNINTPYGYFRITYDDGFSVFIDTDTKLRVAMQGPTGSYSVRKYNAGNNIYSNALYGDGIATYEDIYWENDVHPLDVSNLNDGDTFYLGLRGGVCDADDLEYHYGWLEIEKVGSPGDDCEAILVKDFAFNSSSNYTYIQAGNLTQPLVRFSDSVLKEDLLTDGLFNEIELTLEGSWGFQTSGILNSNQYTFVAYDDTVIAPGFDSKVEVEITGADKAIIRIPTTWDLDNADDFKVRFNFGSGVLVNVDYDYSSAGVISVDFRGADDLIFADLGATNVPVSIGDDRGDIVDFEHIDHVWGTELGFAYLGDPNGFMMYKASGLPYRVEALCDIPYTDNVASDGDIHSSSQIQLFDINQFQEGLYTPSVISNSDFRHIGPGSYSNETPHYPVDGNIYLSNARLSNWKANNGSTAYICIRMTISCDEHYYSWMRIEMEDDGSITPYYLLYQTTPNDITWDEIVTCNSGSESSAIYIDELYVTDITNPGNSSISNDQTALADDGESNYTDYTSQTVVSNPGNTLSIQADQGFSALQDESAYAYPEEYQASLDYYYTWNEHWGVWIDFNNDGYFASNGSESLVLNDTENLLNVAVDIPSSVSPGTYKMRVVLSLNPIYGACQIYSAGETEDYTIQILDPNGGVGTGECLDDIDLTDTISGTESQSTTNSIVANNTIQPTATVILTAENYILFTDGFNAKTGSGVDAYIADCVPGLPKQEEDELIGTGGSLSQLSTYPNPFDQEVFIDFSLAESGEMSILLFNVNGQLIKEIDQRTYSAGMHSVSFDTNDLIPAMYIVKVIGKDFDEHIKLIKTD